MHSIETNLGENKMQTIQALVASGVEAAKAAEQAFREKYGEPFYCGFAWVEVKVERTNSKQAKELLAAGFRKDWQPKTLSMWNPGGSGTQSMDIKSAGAAAMAAVLRAGGVVAYAASRAD